MRTPWGIWIFACLVCLPALFRDKAGSAGELLPPSRTLEKPLERSGLLSVFSEPPELDVRLDGTQIGRTPVWSQEVKAGQHTLKIRDAETAILIESGKTLKIGLFRGEFVTLPDAPKKAADPPLFSPSQRPEKPSERHAKTPAEQERADDVERWQRFIIHGHF